MKAQPSATSLLFDCILTVYSEDDVSDPVSFGIKNSY